MSEWQANSAAPPESSHSTRAMQKPGGDPLVGTVLLGRYHIIKRLGEGGMGTVYLGEHQTIKKRFAIKVLSVEMAAKDDVRIRFLQEARAASMISQQNIVEITDYGDTPDGRVFFVMEFLDGEDLSGTLKQNGPIPWSRVQGIMLQICAALAAAHDAGIIHRDMKPENCYRIRRGDNADFIKVLDFGIAKVTDADAEPGAKGLTKTGMIFGTPEYMCPEQAQGGKVDHRVDVYAVGVIMFELLTGRTPFQGDNFMGILTKHLFEAPPLPRELAPQMNIPVEAEAIILKAMQKDRDLRFSDMREMADAIRAVGTGQQAVAVVQEVIAQPSTGHMSYQGNHAPTLSDAPGATGYPTMDPSNGQTLDPAYAQARPGTWPGAYIDPSMQGWDAPPQSSKAPIWIALAAVVAVGGGVAAWLVGSKGGDPVETPPTDPVAIAATGSLVAPTVEPQPAEPQPAEYMKQLAPETPTVRLKIKTNVDARILDAVDDGIYGMTNTGEGVEVEQSRDRHKFVLRADGYEDLVMEFVPSGDKTFVKELQKSPERKASRSTRGGKEEVSAYDLPKASSSTPALKPPPDVEPDPKPAEPTAAAEPAPAPAPKPEPPKFEPTADATPGVPVPKQKGAKAGDLVDPFGD